MTDFAAQIPMQEALSSAIFLLILALVRFVGVRFVMRGRPEVLSKDQRRWIARLKRGSVVLAVIGLFLIWAPQLHTLAISMVAFALALVVALKEVILGITAGFVRVTTTPFRVGDWIILDGHAGEVVDIDAFTIRMVEIEQTDMSYQYTGRMIAVPNAKIFTSNIVNLQNTREYIFHDVRCVVSYNDVDPSAVFAAFKLSVAKHYKAFETEALANLKHCERDTGVRLGQAEPLPSIQTTEFGNIILLARMYLPTAHVVDVAAAINEDTLSAAHASRLATQRSMLEHEEAIKQAASAKPMNKRAA